MGLRGGWWILELMMMLLLQQRRRRMLFLHRGQLLQLLLLRLVHGPCVYR